MEINSVQTTNPYAGNQADELQTRNREAAQAELSQEDARATRDAFQIRITQEARDMQAAERAAEASAPPEPVRPDQTAQTGGYGNTGPEASRIMNIVA